MFTPTTLIIINATCISLLVILLILLATATRMKGGAGWAAIIIVTTTVPAYLVNTARDIASEYFIFFWYPAITLNLLCMPALWFFTKRQLDKNFRLFARNLLHTIPALISLIASIIYFAPLTAEQIETERAFMENGGENLPAIINDILLFGLFFVYFTAIFFYVRKRKKYLQDNFSDTGFDSIKWTVQFLIAFFVLFFIATVAYAINPRTDVWLIPILNIIAMSYLVYVVIYHSTAPYLNRIEEAPAEEFSSFGGVRGGYALPTMTADQMREICDRVTQYLQKSKAYTKPDFSIHRLAHATKIHQKKISAAINGYLQKNFFEFINTLRVEEAKRQLQTLNAEHTIESIAAECGFRSRTTFFVTFKKFEGVSPAQWLKKN